MKAISGLAVATGISTAIIIAVPSSAAGLTAAFYGGPAASLQHSASDQQCGFRNSPGTYPNLSSIAWAAAIIRSR
jgi:hypothetical protein